MKRRVLSGVPPGHQPIAVVDEVRVTVGLDPYLTVKGLAGYCGLSPRKLRQFLSDPHHPLPCFRVGGKILVRRSDFDRWMEPLRQHGAPDLAAVADAMVRELQSESNAESGGQASQRHVTKGRIGESRKPGAAGAQIVGLNGPLLETGTVFPLEANGPRRA